MIDTLLTEFRATGSKPPLAKYLGTTIIDPLLAAEWVQRCGETLRAEYASQLWGDLDRLLDRLAKNDVPANKVAQVCRAEFKFTRRHIYAFARKGNRGHRKVNAMRQRGGGSNPRPHDWELSRTPIYDDPTVSQYRREPSTHVHSGITQAEWTWPELQRDLEVLAEYCRTEAERELWLKLLIWTSQCIQARIRYIDAARLIDELQRRRKESGP